MIQNQIKIINSLNLQWNKFERYIVMQKSAKIFVAGHTGLLGSVLVKKLEKDGYHNIITRSRKELDLTVQRAVNDFFQEEKPEYVFLAAALVGGILANRTYPASFLHTNIAIQDNVFEAAIKTDVVHLVFYGSSCMYPKNCPQPIKEEYLMTGEIEDTSEGYAIAKISGTIACKVYNNQYKNRRFISLLPNNMYGPNDNFDLENSHVLSALIRKFHDAKKDDSNVILWGSGTPKREFVFNDDVASASIFAMNNADKFENMHYNIGSGVDYSIKDLAQIVSEVVGFEGEIEWDATKPDGTPRKILDSSRFLELGWRPSTDIIQGIRITYDWYKNNFLNEAC
jgi:GDP-L-fucose synthase